MSQGREALAKATATIKQAAEEDMSAHEEVAASHPAPLRLWGRRKDDDPNWEGKEIRRAEEGDLTHERLRNETAHEKAMHSLEQEAFAQEIAHRKKLTEWTFRLTLGWLAFVALCLVANGGTWWWHLPDGIILMLLGTTTVSMIGLYAIILRYFFKGSRPPHNKLMHHDESR